MKKYRVSYYGSSNSRSSKYFDTIHEALRFSIYKLRHPEALFGIDLIED